MTSRVSVFVFPGGESCQGVGSWHLFAVAGAGAQLCSWQCSCPLLVLGGLSQVVLALVCITEPLGDHRVAGKPPISFPTCAESAPGLGGTRRVLHWGSGTPIPRLVECPTWGQGGSDGDQAWLCSQSSWALRCTEEEAGAQQRPQGPGLREAAHSIVL